MADVNDELANAKKRLAEAEGYLRIDDIRDRRIELEDQAAQPDLWDDMERARKVNRELAEVTEDTDLFDRLTQELEDVETMVELAAEDADAGLDEEIAEALASMTREFDDLELRALFTGEWDEKDAVCQIQSGEGGTDAQDWASMLLSMYKRWADSRGLDFEVIAVSEGAPEIAEPGVVHHDVEASGLVGCALHPRLERCRVDDVERRNVRLAAGTLDGSS